MDAVTIEADRPELTWVRAAQAGEVEAFARLVQHYQRRAVSVAFRILHHAEDARDVSQDAFVRAFRSLEQLEDPSCFGAWLLRIVTNLALNFRRANKGRQVSSLEDSATLPMDARDPISGQAAVADFEDEGGPLTDELRAGISAALDRLPEKQRLALILFSVEGLPQKEVAQILECSIELVKWNVFQARRALKEMLTEYL